MKLSQIVPRALIMALTLTLGLPMASAANRVSQYGAEPMEGYQEIDLFQAINDGVVDVQFIAKNAKEANIIIKNKMGKPLAIKMPAAFAGVPVLAQFGGGGGGQGGFGGGGQGGGGGGFQGGGGGFGGQGGGQGGGGGGQGGFFNVAPEKVGKMKVDFMCLEHGKKDPTARTPYKIVPITEFTQDTNVIELCKMLGRGEISQNIAQAAAWHLTDGLSWNELASKNRVEFSNGYTEKFFNGSELHVAFQATQEAARRAKVTAEERSKSNKGSKADSLSSK
jgi:hypothetical protein